jgi:hypothetical protein
VLAEGNGDGVSAGFDFDGEVFWGTNGAIEAYVEVMGEVAARLYGADDPLATFLRDELEVFFQGKVVLLDACVESAEGRRRLLRVLDEATSQIVSGDTLTEYGRTWVATTISALRAKLTAPDTKRNDGSSSA